MRQRSNVLGSSAPPFWRLAFFIAITLFLNLAVIVVMGGVFRWEVALHESVQRLVAESPTVIIVSSKLTRLGSESVILPVGLVTLALLPTGLLSRWWLWIAVIIGASSLEGLAKDLIARPRPIGQHPGFPSGHTTAAAAFYVILAYFIGHARAAQSVLWRVWAPASMVVIAVALSRLVLRAHWALDVLGGATLGVAVASAAVWWHETHRSASAAPRLVRVPRLQNWLRARNDVVPLPFYGVLFLTPPFLGDESAFDLVCDVGGVVIVFGALALRVWAVAQSPLHTRAPEIAPALITSGPYAYLRHPMYVAHLALGVGVGLLAENMLALVVLPIVTSMLYRIVVPAEEAELRARFGEAYDRYCAEVPQWMPRRSGRGGAGARWDWIAVRRDYRAVLTAAVLAVIGQLSEDLPHLFD